MMKKVYTIIALITLYLIVYQLLSLMTGTASLIIAMFLLSPFLVLYMVFAVLKYGTPSKHHFNDRFYEDWDYQRNNPVCSAD